MRRLAALLTFTFLIGLQTPARAGVFEVRSCGANSPNAFTLANDSPQSIAASSQCPQNGMQLLSGMYAGASSSGFTLAGRGASWTIAAPSGLQLNRLDAKRSLGRLSASWSVEVSTPGRLLESCGTSDPANCRHGAAGGEMAAYTELGSQSATFRIECRPPAGDEDLACVGRPSTQAWIAIYSATALVNDPAPPAVASLTGALVAPGWHRGVEDVNLSASDASGVKSLTLVAGDTRLFETQQACDYSRMQPCPASLQQAASVDTSKLADGTYELRAVATDAADQPGTQTATLKVDRHAPEMPANLAVERNADGTLAFAWTNPDQGVGAPIVGARYAVCDALGVSCVAGGLVAAPNITRLGAVAIPAGEHVVRVWLQDEAGNADAAGAATITVDPSSITARRTVATNPPVLEPGPAPSATLRITKARQRGSTLTLTGTIAKRATATLTARVSKGRTTRTLATAKTKPKAGKWSLKVKLKPSLRRSNTMYVRVAFAGQSAYAKTTALRKLTKRPASRGNTTEEFSLESRSGR